jgi:hypothetical protein
LRKWSRVLSATENEFKENKFQITIKTKLGVTGVSRFFIYFFLENLATKHWISIIGLVLGGAIATIISIYQFVDGVNKDKENDNLQKELITTQKELSVLQNETTKKVMGHGYTSILASTNTLTSFKLFAISKSDYPIYDFGVMIYNQDEINKCPKVTNYGENRILLSCFNRTGYEIPIFNLGSKKTQDLGYEVKLDSDKHLFIKMITKYNVVFQYSIIKADPRTRKFVHNYRIFEMKETPILLEKMKTMLMILNFKKSSIIKRKFRCSTTRISANVSL